MIAETREQRRKRREGVRMSRRSGGEKRKRKRKRNRKREKKQEEGEGGEIRSSMWIVRSSGVK